VLIQMGRTVASNKEEAMQNIKHVLDRKGLKLVRVCSLFPAPVQPYKLTWWEYYLEVVSNDAP